MRRVVLTSWPQLRHGEQTNLKPTVNFMHIIPKTRVTGLGREPNNLIQSQCKSALLFDVWEERHYLFEPG